MTAPPVTASRGARKDASPAHYRLLELLADGEWHDGPSTFNKAGRVVPPGEASRAGRKNYRHPDHITLDKLIESGRREITRSSLAGLLERGRVVIEADSPDGKMTRAHWRGDASWRMRDLLARTISVQQAADELGMPDHVLRLWISAGYVPVTKVGTSPMRFTPEQMVAVRKVHGAWPGPGRHWPFDPRSLWATPPAELPAEAVEGGPAEPGTFEHKGVSGTFYHGGCGHSHMPGDPCPEGDEVEVSHGLAMPFNGFVCACGREYALGVTKVGGAE